MIAGDGLERIAEQFGVSTAAIAERNGLTAPYTLSVGQVLIIPSPE